jgi:hypothetical protein
MEQIVITLGVPEEFDRLVHCGTAQASHIQIATKDAATVSGKPGVVIAFDVEIGGKRVPVQATTTLNCLATAFYGLRGRYGPGGPEAHRFGKDNPFIA